MREAVKGRARLERSRLAGRRTLVVLFLLLAVYEAVFLFLVYERYLAFELYDVNDTAANLQTVWSLVHGPFFTASVNAYLKDVPHNVLGDQLYFTLIFYLPFWLIFKSPFTFAVVTIVAAGVAALPLYFLAVDRLQRPGAALIIAAHYLFNPLAYDTYFLFGFRPEVFFLPFLFSAFFFLFRRRYYPALLFFLLTLLTKHDSILVLGGLGLGLLLRPGPDRRFGLLLLLLSLLYYFGVVAPLFAHFSYSPTAMIKQLSLFGDTPLAVLRGLLSHPGRYFQEVSQPELEFLGRFLLSSAFLCLLSPFFYPSLPIIFYNFLYNEYGSLHCGWHWAIVVPFIYLGALDALVRLRRWFDPATVRWRRAALIALVAGLFFQEAAALAERVSWRRGFYYRDQKVDSRKIMAAVEAIPPEASVSAMYRLLWFAAFRRHLFYNCHEPYNPDYVAVLAPLHLGQNDMTDWCTIAQVEDPHSVLYREYDLSVIEGCLLIFRKRTP